MLFENGVTMEHITFNAVGATSTTWFTESRMTSSSWTDMIGNTFNYFSQEGYDLFIDLLKYFIDVLYWGIN